MKNIPVPQQIYRHFKGNLYQIVSLAEHTETGEQLVIYQALYGDFKVYARPVSMFLEKVDRVKYPDASQEYRFELVEKSGNPEPAETLNDDRPKQKEEALNDDRPKQKEEAYKNDNDNGGDDGLNIDPLVLQFLDAGSYEERLDILAALHHRITDEMINTMAMAVDVEVKEGDIEERYTELRKCLLLYDKFECTRLRG